MSRKDCQAANWWQLGYDDSQGPRADNYVEKREKSCEKYKMPIDKQSYDRGHEQGLKEYCTVSHFYFLGETGNISRPAKCESNQSGKLASAYEDGRKLYDLRRRRDRIQKEIEDFNKDRSVVSDVNRVASVFSGHSPTSAQERELALVDSEITTTEAMAPDSNEYCKYEMTRKNLSAQLIPNFLLDYSPGTRAELESCSRNPKDTIQE